MSRQTVTQLLNTKFDTDKEFCEFYEGVEKMYYKFLLKSAHADILSAMIIIAETADLSDWLVEHKEEYESKRLRQEI